MSYCCESMERYSTLNCTEHSNIYECPDVLVSVQVNNRHGIIVHDGGSSQIEIHYCPWCGVKVERKETTREKIKRIEEKAMEKLGSEEGPDNVA